LDPLARWAQFPTKFHDVNVHGPLVYRRVERSTDQLGPAEGAAGLGHHHGEEPELGWGDDDFLVRDTHGEPIRDEAEVRVWR
jgi:hypothetical protein